MGIIRKTKSVQTLLHVFEEHKGAISVVNLVDQLQTEMNKTTIYRILDRLEDQGIVHSFLGKEGLKWYAKCNGCSSAAHKDIHPHFQCQKCGKVDCIHLDINIPQIPNRKINHSQLLLIGICEDCS